MTHAAHGVTFPTWVEVDLDALEHNITEVRRRVGDERRILLVVKADAYGHGAPEVSRAAVAGGVDALGVATLHEGIELRRAGIRVPVLILSPTLPGEIDDILAHELRPAVSTEEYARAFSERAAALGRPGIVHVEVDTGMGRSGCDEGEALALLRTVSALPHVQLEGVFTHFPDVGPGHTDVADDQLRRFRALIEAARAERIAIPLTHAANSAGLLSVRDAFLDMVRPGLLLYGHTHTGVGVTENLRPVMTFKTRVVLVRRIAAGRTISYDRTYTTPRPSVIAVVPAGYGHGMSTKLSNTGEVLVHGARARIVGRVTMDVTMVDVTDVPGVAVGDEVVLFGEQAGARITLEEVARASDTLSYDVLISIGKRVPRVFFRDRVPTKATTLVGEVPGAHRT
jgi:alanine racemase